MQISIGHPVENRVDWKKISGTDVSQRQTFFVLADCLQGMGLCSFGESYCPFKTMLNPETTGKSAISATFSAHAPGPYDDLNYEDSVTHRGWVEGIKEVPANIVQLPRGNLHTWAVLT